MHATRDQKSLEAPLFKSNDKGRNNGESLIDTIAADDSDDEEAVEHARCAVLSIFKVTLCVVPAVAQTACCRHMSCSNVSVMELCYPSLKHCSFCADGHVPRTGVLRRASTDY